ncbi:cytochrome c biogenesis protein ResB [Pseudalkalibacillus caeni]|uniref:Cytochrome c biogenesis protein n=1 Tax=Exobacillus caeni TaxID=2574798 RepID=A0A5R9EZS9_9BACL|nr:cytochrome c biogenesis protein ResB [Pseudalkalibacillus caeni]TLS35630.1 cytochrome c biogenesis protein [Pseudalkalibacillus caeni]
MDKKQISCECGHVNPYGTQICESCGKPLHEDDSKKLLNMRYEGSARRSQTYKKTPIDKVWNFFSSVKVGIWIIILLLVASAIGTIFPQEMYIPPQADPTEYYKEQYGFLGQLYYQLGFHNLYGSWWFMLLIAALGLSLIIASLDRFVPLYRSLKKQRVTRHESFMKRQRIFGVTSGVNEDKAIDKAKEAIKKKGYNVREEDGNLLAEKNRFSRWGPYVNHVGLIIFLIGGMLRFFPGMYLDEVMWLREGQTEAIPGTEGSYYLKNEDFILEMYDENDEQFKEAMERVNKVIPKNYQTDAVLYKQKGERVAGQDPELEKVKKYPIQVNKPLKIDGLGVYQVDYKLNELQAMTFKLENKDSGKTFGEMTVDLYNPKEVYELKDGYRVEVMNYFPDFEFNDKDEPTTKSKIPNNPAFIFKMFSPEHPDGEVAFVAIRQNLEPLGENEYKMSFQNVETKDVSGLVVKKDNTLWILAFGGAIFMIGVVMGMYWNHRRIWIRRMDNEIWMAGHANKNWHGLKRELQTITEASGLNMPEDQADEDEKKS